MSRHHFAFDCAGARLVGTLDEAPGSTGLLIVSGGNEVRAGAWNGQALLAAEIAMQGYPVMRFDRRGVGDSEGVNAEFRSSGPDIAAALTAFHERCPWLSRVVGFGNCDAASALMLARGAECDALVLGNPWTIENDNEAAPAEVVRDHYRRRLADPAAIRRLLTGKVSLVKLARSLFAAARPAPQQSARPTGLAGEISDGLQGFDGPVRFLIAGRDRTGLAFLSRWNRNDPRLRTCPQASHSFVEDEAQDWLVSQVLEVLEG
ncbi:hydrolase 1, exosortase A system-associated [Novosphingobium colocasiae]|uniref:hydrolase 1, exosortase A system-associated n=1 Tax=Novosphingobium colocasiae TaxID=1256513 RepID=UPI0035B1203B